MLQFCSSNPLGFFVYWWNHSCAPFYEIYDFALPSFASYLVLFFLTLLFETPVYYLFLRRRFSNLKILLVSLALNLSTHPIVIYGVPMLVSRLGGHEGHVTLIGESFAPIVEFLILALGYKVRPARAFFAALTANLFSWLFGGWFIFNFLM